MILNMSDEALSLESELSSNEEGNSSSSKNVLKRKLSNLSSNEDKNKENFPKKIRKVQPESSNRNQNKKKVVKPQFVGKIKVSTPNSDDAIQNFMKICLERRSDDDTKKVLQKLEKLYNKLSSVHKSDDKFKLYINACHEKIMKNLSKDIYTPILELHTEIKNRIQKKLEEKSTSDTEFVAEVSEENKKKIQLLEEAIKKCQIKIKELREKEVDFDDDEDSVYIQQDKYEKKLVQLCNSLSELSGNKAMRKEIFKKKIRRKDIPGEMTNILLVDEAVIHLVNANIRKINKMKYLENQGYADVVKMPDFLDVLQCIEKCNKDNNLDLSKEKMTRLAKGAFKDLGKFLQNKRLNDSKNYILSLISDETEDPAEKDNRLLEKLKKNKAEGDKKLDNIFKKYLDEKDGSDKKDIEEQAEGSFDEVEADDENENNKDEKEKEILETDKVKIAFMSIHQKLKCKEILKNNAVSDTALNSKNISKDNTVTETAQKFKEVVKDNTVAGTSFKSKEILKDSAVTETALKSKKTVKDNTVEEATLKSKEAVKDNRAIGATPKSKETVKDNTITKTVPKSKETFKNNTHKSNNSENEIITKKREHFEKTAPIDDDLVIIDSSDDDCVEVESPRDIKKISERKLPSIRTKAEPKGIPTVVVESPQLISPAVTSTPMMIAPYDYLTKTPVGVARVDDSQKVKTFIKVRAFAKSPSAWVDDKSIVKSSWLSDG